MATRSASGWTFLDGPLDDPPAETLREERVAYLHEQGWKLRPRWDRRAPLGVVKREHSTYYVASRPGLLDHPYRLVSPEGRVIYVSEPYQLEDYGIAELAALDGWDVMVYGSRALWYPGHTVAIWFIRNEESQ